VSANLPADDQHEVPAQVVEPWRSALRVALAEWRRLLGRRLVSVVLFGSVARGGARPDSDVDLLLVVEGLPRSLAERRRPLLEAWRRGRERESLQPVQWDLVVKDREEAAHHSPLYLDMVAEGALLHDSDGFFAGVLEEMRARMAELGSRRVYLSNGSWYWDLKPGSSFGEVIEI
jgi:predicted nucleotidyltransferase